MISLRHRHLLAIIAEAASHSRLLRRDGARHVQVLSPCVFQDSAAEANRASARARARLPAVKLDKKMRYQRLKLDPEWLEAKRERDRERRRRAKRERAKLRRST